MKKLICVFVLCLAFIVFAQGQGNSVKVVIQNEVFELVPQVRDDSANFQIVEIKSKGKILKKISVGAVLFPQIVGTFNGFDASYLLYRTDMGQGACAGGSLYIIKFNENSSTGELSFIEVSPVLTTCLGEYPIFSLTYTNNGVLTLIVAGHTMNLDLMDKWVENKKTVEKRSRK